MTRSRSADAVALAFALAVHGGVFLLLMLQRLQAPQPPTPPSDLALFDVGVPPPPPLPKPTRRRVPTRPANILPGGSRPAAIPPVVTPAAAAPQAPVPLPARPSSVTSPIDDGDDDAVLASASPPDPGQPGRDGDGTDGGTGNGVGPGSLRFGRAEWIRAPDLNDVKRYLPGTTRARGVTVSVELGCIVPTPGKPKRCWVVSESPRGLGFGHAAVAMSGTFRIRPMFINDQAMNLPVLVPISFQVSSRPASPKP